MIGTDRERIARAVAEVLAGAGEDVRREGLRGTPARVATLYGELLAGMREDPVAALQPTLPVTPAHHLVLLRDLPFYSLCEHHLLPFFGQIQLGYLPNERLAGLGQLARAADVLARRLQLQERLTEQLADALVAALEPRGVAVLVEAEQLCLTMRGAGGPASRLLTAAFRGRLAEPQERASFLALLGRGGERAPSAPGGVDAGDATVEER